MKRIRSRSLAAASLAAALMAQVLVPAYPIGFAPEALAAARPRYGGTLRVEMQAALTTLDPSESWPGAAERSALAALAPLVFDRLVQFDNAGNILPALATSWQSDPRAQEWQFRLRPGVRFHDGRLLTPSVVAESLTDYAQKRGGIWRASTFGETVVLRTSVPHPQLLYELAGPECSIYRRDAQGNLQGTGPFRIAEWDSGRLLRLAAYDAYWAGRPFLDAIEVKLARPLREQGIALGLGQADLIQLSPDQVRSVSSGARAWSSLPVQLFALTIPQPSLLDARLRQALSLSIDRPAIRDVLLNKNGEAAFIILPAWLSGYAFTFDSPRDVEYARQLVQQLSLRETALTLSYDPGDALAKAVADRVAVNAAEAGIRIQATAREPSRPEAAHLLLRRLDLDSLLSVSVVDGLESQEPAQRAQWLHPLAVGLAPQDYFDRERQSLDGRTIPIVHFPVSYGLSSRVRNWAPAKWGEWRLADVWLDEASAPTAKEQR